MPENKEESQSSFPPPPSLEVGWKLTEPLRKYFQPQFFGIDEIDASKPALYVTNHTVYGIADGTLFIAELYKRKGIFLRSLADDMHFSVPIWKDIVVKQMGLIRGSRENCAALMKAGEHILVYPGGARETFKQKGDEYKLTWKKRLGFARMAIEHGYDIIPVASIGGDDAYDIVFDSKDIMNSFIGKYLKNSGIAEKYLKNGENIPPISLGLLGTALPKPVKLYISFGERIDTKKFEGKHNDEAVLWQVRNEVELSMYNQFLMMMEYRKKDKTGFWRKLFT